MFENKLIRGIHTSRYIMSWVRAGGELGMWGVGIDDFYKWLLSIGLTETEADYIKFLATNGKLELENSAERFLNKN